MDKTGPPDGENIKKWILTEKMLFPKHYARHFQKYYFIKKCIYELVSQRIYYKLTEKLLSQAF